MKKRYAVAMLLALAAWAVRGAEAQDSPQASVPSFQTSTKLVLVPVVVRDREGRTVSDLGRDSFQVFDRGKPQRIEAFSVERSEASQLATATMVAPEHFIAYFFDDVSLHDFGTVAPLREAALHSIAGLQPSDRAAIFSSSCRLAMDFTDDRAKLQEVIAKLEPNPIRVCRVTPTLPLQITLLDALVRRMAHLPGAKRIVIVSAGFFVNRDEQRMREALIDEAVQAKVSMDSLHIVESRGDMGSAPPPQQPGWSGRRGDIPYSADVNSENLNVVADGTGGTVVEAGNSPEAGLRQLATPNCVYLLSFVPEEKADGSYHKLKVTVKDSRKLRVQARAGYYATKTAVEQASVPEAVAPAEPPAAAQPAPNPPPPAAQPQAGEITTREGKPAFQPQTAEASVREVKPPLPSQTEEIATREEIPYFQSSVNLVRVPVVVRDKQGHTVGTFHKEDFQLSDRGKQQSIAQFAVEGAAAARPNPAGAGHARPAAPAREIPPAPAAGASKPVVPSRFVAFVFDDVHLKLDDLMNARVAALKHIGKGIPPQERIALLTLSGTVSLEFTDDLVKFREALMKIMPQPPRSHFPPASFFVADQWMNRDDSQALAMQVAITIDCLHLDGPAAAAAADIAKSTLREVANEGRGEAINAFRTLNNIVRLLGSMPGDRIMILASPGMYLPDELQRELSESIDRATRSGVVINTLDARGVYTIDPTGDVPNCRLTNPQTEQLVGRYHNFANTAQGMILGDLADSTGGTALSGNDLAGEFDRLANPPEYVYYLGFYPKDLKPDGRYHEIKVTLVEGKGLSVQARRGYWAPSRVEDAAAAATREIGEAVFSRDEVHDLPVDMRTAVSRGQGTAAELSVMANIDLKLLHLVKADGRNSDDVTVVAAVFDRNGNYLEGKQHLLKLRLRDETLAGLEQKPPETLKSTFNLGPGTYLVRLVARSADAGAMTTTSGSVEIPQP
ncbi:MAG: VWA domain-containing protein [Bryobacteraceae bacterium]